MWRRNMAPTASCGAGTYPVNPQGYPLSVRGVAGERAMRANVSRLGLLIKALLGGRDTRSPAFRHFWFSFYEERDYPRHRLDVGALIALEGRERDLAERMLIEALPDLRAVVGLGELVSFK